MEKPLSPAETNLPTALVNVSIINYRTPDLTIQCAQSVLEDTRDFDCMVSIVDNASGDGSLEQLQAWRNCEPQKDRVQVIASASNTGFSGGHNQGMAACNADYHLILNSDAVVRTGFFKALLAAAEAEPDRGLFAPRIDYDDGGQQISCFRLHTPWSELIRGAETGPVTRLLQRYKVPLTLPPRDAQIGWASFACILLRDKMVQEVGAMDEGYFLYFEDVDYCWKARQSGWRIRYVPDAQLVHFRGGSGPVKSLIKEQKRLPAYYYASRTRVFYRMHGFAGLFLANMLWCLGRVIAQLRRFLGKPVPPTNHREFQDLWINFLTPLGDDRAARDN